MTTNDEAHEDEADDDREPAERWLCSSCVGEQYLSAEIDRIGQEHECDYCNQIGMTLPIEELADYVEGAFERHYAITSTEPSPTEYAMMSDSDYHWHREGEPVVWAIASAIESDGDRPAKDIQLVLADRHHDEEARRMGEETPFGDSTHYTTIAPNDIEFRENWRYFENSLKTEARFFNATAEATLATVFQGLHGHKMYNGRPVVVEAGPGTAIDALYRARVFQSIEKLEEALKRPEVALGPPPSQLAGAGRLNARGISVFYGATDPNIAAAEVRPPVGSRVALARFELLRSMRLLDVVALRSLYVEGSIFDPGYINRLELAKFLERLSNRFAAPVMPDDESLDYLPTQAIADYLSSQVTDPSLDGILYPSVQADQEGANVVLFYQSSRVASLELPQGTEIKVHSGRYTDEEWEEDWWIWEAIPSLQPEMKEDMSDLPDIGTIFLMPSSLESDFREPSLRIDTSSIEIRYVRAAQYAATIRKVRRHKT